MKIVTVSAYDTETGATRSQVFPYGDAGDPDSNNVTMWVVAHDKPRSVEANDNNYHYLEKAYATEEVNGIELYEGDS